MKLRAKASYLVWCLYRFGLLWPFKLFEHFIQIAFHDAEHDGIRLVNICSLSGSEEVFLQRTREALEYISTHDPRRYRRIKREVRCIINCPLLSTGAYSRPFRWCMVDFNRLDFATHPEWYHYYLSALLVHEATHGSFYSLWIGYTKKTRRRIERLCCLEEKRFAKRAIPEWAQEGVGAFDPLDWQDAWHQPRSQRRRRLWAYAMETYIKPMMQEGKRDKQV